MKFAITAALLAALAAPVYSLSYLESLGGTSTAPPKVLSSPGLKPKPVAAGGGMSSYLDALPQNDSAAAAGAPPAAGMTSYANAMASSNRAAPPAPPAQKPAVSYAPPTPPVVGTSTSYTPAPAAQVPAGGNYLEALAKTTSSAAPSGAGIGSYLDALPKNNSIGGKRGPSSYADNLSGGSRKAPATRKKSYAPFVSSSSGKALSDLSYSPFHSEQGRTFVGVTSPAPANAMAPDNFVGLVGPSPDTSISLLHQLQNHVGVIRLGGVLPKKTSYGHKYGYGLGLTK